MKSHGKQLIVSLLILLFACVASANGTTATTRKGTVYVYDNGSGLAKVHTYMAPYQAAANTSVIIELTDQLIIVDFQFGEIFANEFRAYADSLGKKISRAYLSHEHPDHWMGSIAFQDIPTYALPEVVAFVKTKGDTILKKKGKPGKIPNFAGVVEPGTEKIAGLTFEFSKYKNSESHDALLIALPEVSTVIAQDLLYANSHFYLGNDNFNNWINSLQKMQQQYKNYQWFIPGHGAPQSSPLIISDNIAYLEETNRAFSTASGDKEKIKAQLLDKFPEYKCAFFLSFGLDHAMQRPQQHK